MNKLKQWFPTGFADGRLLRYAMGVYYEHWSKPNDNEGYRMRELNANRYTDKVQKQTSDL